MKKVLVLVVALMLLLSVALAGCAQKADEPAAPEAPAAEEESEAPAEVEAPAEGGLIGVLMPTPVSAAVESGRRFHEGKTRGAGLHCRSAVCQ